MLAASPARARTASGFLEQACLTNFLFNPMRHRRVTAGAPSGRVEKSSMVVASPARAVATADAICTSDGELSERERARARERERERARERERERESRF